MLQTASCMWLTVYCYLLPPNKNLLIKIKVEVKSTNIKFVLFFCTHLF